MAGIEPKVIEEMCKPLFKPSKGGWVNMACIFLFSTDGRHHSFGGNLWKLS